jgi:galactofuranose transport system ATP-binding protein
VVMRDRQKVAELDGEVGVDDVMALIAGGGDHGGDHGLDQDVEKAVVS